MFNAFKVIKSSDLKPGDLIKYVSHNRTYVDVGFVLSSHAWSKETHVYWCKSGLRRYVADFNGNVIYKID